MIITSFDIGVINMAVSVGVFGKSRQVEYKYAKNIDIRQIRCTSRKCIYERSDKTAAHRIMHYLEKLHKVIKNSNVMLIENQPLVGLTNVEQSLYIYCKNKYRHAKVMLISPCAVYKHFNMSKSKEERIQQVIDKYAHKIKKLDDSDEPQHVCDAINITEYYVDKYVRGTFEKNPFKDFVFNGW